MRWDADDILDNNCHGAVNIGQHGGTCYYYAVLIPLFWSRPGAFLLRELLRAMERSDRDMIRSLVHRPNMFVEIFRDIAFKITGREGPTPVVQLKDVGRYAHPRDIEGHARFIISQAVTMLQTRIHDQNLPLMSMIRFPRAIQTFYDFTHRGVHPIVLGDDSALYRIGDTTFRAPDGGDPISVIKFFNQGIRAKYPSFPYKIGTRNIIDLEYYGNREFVIKHGFRRSKRIAENMIMGILVGSKTHVIPVVPCKDSWYAFNNHDGKNGLLNAFDPFIHLTNPNTRRTVCERIFPTILRDGYHDMHVVYIEHRDLFNVDMPPRTSMSSMTVAAPAFPTELRLIIIVSMLAFVSLIVLRLYTADE
jgi:hypothetical protein